jgi:uncharacterized delta-60 repeat protein
MNARLGGGTLFVGVVAAALVITLGLPALAVGGDLDPSWGGSGFVTTPFPGGYSFGNGVVARGNQVIAVGIASSQDAGDFALAAYTSDGSLDQTYGAGGEVTTSFNDFDVATAAAYQGDDLVVAGYTLTNSADFDFAVARYNKDGSLDQSFGTGGKVTTDFGGSEDIADAVTIEGDKIIVAGGTTSGGDENFALARYNKDGSLDQSFGTGGLVTTDFDGGFDAANSVKVMENRVVAVGYANFRNDSNFALARYMDDGSLDPSFGSGGKVETDFNGGEDAAHSVDIRGETIVAVGSAERGPMTTNQDFAVAEYDKYGALDPRFGGNGKTTLDMGGDDEADAGAIQYDGRVVAVGGTPDGQFGDHFAVARFLSDGSPDPSFGGGTGFTTTQIGVDSDAYAVALGPDNRIVAAGYASLDGVNYEFAVARYLAN